MPFNIVRNDITRMQVDAIVNAANEGLRHGGGVCGAIFAAAGPAQLQAACDKIGHCDTGSAVATPAFALPANHVIHAVGPIWHGGAYGEEEALRGCYRSSLELAAELGDESIAFPLISSGIYGYPKDQAIDVAISEIHRFLDTHEMDVYLIIFDAEALRASTGRFGEIAQLVDDTYVRHSAYERRARWEQTLFDGGLPAAPPPAASAPMPAPPVGSSGKSGGRTTKPREGLSKKLRSLIAPAERGASEQSAAPTAAPVREGARADTSLEDLLDHLDASFSTTLLSMIDQRGLKDSEVYKRANMSRQHFSKIRSNPAYQPKKHTVFALAVALELDAHDTRLLLERAGFALTHADKRDIIVEHFIEQKNYDIYEINLALYAFDQPLLG
ncbi:MAG: macro domain-containing protein [Coriobacteriales bacterium]|nr:macro domain-containing protein [Coriobacteriales bacterium]